MKAQIRYILIYIFNIFYNIIPFFFLKKMYLRIFDIHLGNNAYIHTPTRFFDYRSKLIVGDNTTINPNSYIDNRGSVTIGNNVNISHDVKLYTGGHDVDSQQMDYFSKEIIINDDVWIFPNVIIMPGVVIGEGAVVYPGSVVTKNVASFNIVAGIPAKFIKKRKTLINYKLNHGKWFVF